MKTKFFSKEYNVNPNMKTKKLKGNVHLREEQKKHLETIEWLNSDLKGKSFLIAYALVKKANENRGQFFQMWDHKYCRDLEHIRKLVDEIALSLKLKAEFKSIYKFRIRGTW